MKYQVLFSSKDKSKKIKMSSAAILLGSLRVKLLCSEVKLACALTQIDNISILRCFRIHS